MGGLTRRDLAVDDPAQGLPEVHDLLAHLDPAGVDTRDVEHLREQPGHPVRIGVDGVEHQLLLFFGETVPLRQQGGGEALDARQRRAQLVGDGRDQVGAVALHTLPAGGVPQGQRDVRQLPVHPDITNGDVEVALVTLAGQGEAAFGLTGHPRQAAGDPRALPPVVAPLVQQRQDFGEVLARGRGGGHTGNPGGGRVEHLDPALAVHDHDPVREIVPVHRQHGWRLGGGGLAAGHPVRPRTGGGQRIPVDLWPAGLVGSRRDRVRHSRSPPPTPAAPDPSLACARADAYRQIAVATARFSDSA